ncbi:uncharacterized protein LOC62_01G000037 [Vanrija pseudolonga]|uniref:Uncharacterized protein n=1 Tax=Vanrija pseudolonga TaxID=143232 RepID=A0AAF0Y2H2_9TREE|nr:hypothetical protein LOC62_01G000037 [Vanrija pseudolonga]
MAPSTIPRLPQEIQDMILDLALRDPTAQFNLLASLRGVNRRLHAVASARLYAHVAIVATRVPVYGPPAPRPLPSSPRYNEYTREPRQGLRLDVVSASGRRIPGLEWNGGIAARQRCVERLAAHCTVLDGANQTYMTIAASAPPAEQDDRRAAFAGVTTYRNHSLHPLGVNTPSEGIATCVAFANVPNSTAELGREVYRGLARQEGYGYLLVAGPVCNVLGGALPPSVRTAVVNIAVKANDVTPYAVHLDECAGLREIVFILRKAAGRHSVGVGRDAGHGFERSRLGVAQCLVLALAKARQLRRVTFVGLEAFGTGWLSDESEDEDSGSEDAAQAPQAQSEDAPDAPLLSDTEAKELWRRRRRVLAQAITEEIARDQAHADADAELPDVAVLSLDEFRRANTDEFYELCTSPCIYSRY